MITRCSGQAYVADKIKVPPLAKYHINIYQIPDFQNTENSSEQNLECFQHATGGAIESATSYPYSSYPQILEQSVRWLLRTRLDKIWVKKEEEEEEEAESPQFVWETV